MRVQRRLSRVLPTLRAALARLRWGPALLALALVLASLKTATTILPDEREDAMPADAMAAPRLPDPRPEPAAGPGDDPEQPPPRAAEPDPLTHPPTTTEQRLLADLSRRRELLDAREKELDLRARLLATTGEEIATQIETLAQIKRAIESLLDEHDASEEAEITRLVKIYETMKPKAAAEIFDRLDMYVLLELATRMKEIRTSAIMARMMPARAEALTQELAHRRRLGALVAARLGEPAPRAGYRSSSFPDRTE